MVTTFFQTSLFSAVGEAWLFEAFGPREGGFVILGQLILFIYGITVLLICFYLPMTIRREP